MKTVLIILSFFSSMPMLIWGQLTIQNNNIRIGDKIVKQQVEYKDPGRSGSNVIWNFSSLEPINPEYKLYYTAPRENRRLKSYILGRDTFKVEDISDNELIVGVEHRTKYFYHIKNNIMYCLGYENPTVLMHHKTPQPVINYPFSYGKEIAHTYNSEGLYSSQVPIQIEGEIYIQSDAIGKMILPSKDTLKHVIRIKTIKTVIEKDTIEEDTENIPVHMLIENYRWFSKGYRYPVFETIKSVNLNDSVKEAFTTAFFYPPQEHYYLEDDPKNLALLDSLDHISNNGGIHDLNQSGNTSNWIGKLGNLLYNYYPNPIETDLFVEYYLNQDAKVGISLYDMSGKQIITISEKNQEKGLYYETIECSSLIAGNYILRLVVNNEIINEKILKK